MDFYEPIWKKSTHKIWKSLQNDGVTLWYPICFPQCLVQPYQLHLIQSSTGRMLVLSGSQLELVFAPLTVITQTKAYWFSIALEWPFSLLSASIVSRTEPPWMTAGLLILVVWMLRARRRPSPGLAWTRDWIIRDPPLFIAKFVSMTSEGPPLSRGIGLLLKCSSMSNMLWNQRCWTRHCPSVFKASLRCCRSRIAEKLWKYNLNNHNKD